MCPEGCFTSFLCRLESVKSWVLWTSSESNHGMQADLIGAEFKDPQSQTGPPLHEELYTKLVAAGTYSSHGREHMISTVHAYAVLESLCDISRINRHHKHQSLSIIHHSSSFINQSLWWTDVPAKSA